MLAAEQLVGEVFEHLFAVWLPKVRKRVFGNGAHPDPAAVFAVAPEYATQARAAAVQVIPDIYNAAYVQAFDVRGAEPIHAGLNFTGHGREQDYLATAVNRLVNVPDQVYALINDRVSKATAEGWDLDQLAGEIDTLLEVNGADRWTNRAMTIARTEAVGAFNAGTYAGFLDFADQMGGRWEKAWLATEDTRTRPTHHRADLQRVPLRAVFTVGGFPALRPHDPQLPPEELINCRCSLLLLRPGERIDLTDRQLKKAA